MRNLRLKSRGFVGGSKWPSTDFQGLDLSGRGLAGAAAQAIQISGPETTIEELNMRIDGKLGMFLIACVTCLLFGCANNPKKTYLDYASEAIQRKDWEIAYRLLEDSLGSNDPLLRKRALDLIDAYPQVQQAALETFSFNNLMNLKRINEDTAWSVEEKRLMHYQQSIATHEQYTQALRNYQTVYGEINSPEESNKKKLPVKKIDPAYIHAARHAPIRVRHVLTDEHQAPIGKDLDSTNVVSGGITAAALLYPPTAAYLVGEFIGTAIGSGVISLVQSSKADDPKVIIINKSNKIDFIKMVSDAITLQHAFDKDEATELENESNQSELIVDHYGFSKNACFFVDATLSFLHKGREVYREHLVIDRYPKSEDAPEVECSNWTQLAENNGRQITQIAERHAQELAMMTGRRLGW